MYDVFPVSTVRSTDEENTNSEPTQAHLGI
jgi:hypothetical protein